MKHIPLIPWCPSLFLDDSNSFPQQWNAMPVSPSENPCIKGSYLTGCDAFEWELLRVSVALCGECYIPLHPHAWCTLIFISILSPFKGYYSSRQRQTTKINKKRACSLSKLPILFVLLTLTWQPTLQLAGSRWCVQRSAFCLHPLTWTSF